MMKDVGESLNQITLMIIKNLFEDHLELLEDVLTTNHKLLGLGLNHSAAYPSSVLKIKSAKILVLEDSGIGKSVVVSIQESRCHNRLFEFSFLFGSKGKKEQ